VSTWVEREGGTILTPTYSEHLGGGEGGTMQAPMYSEHLGDGRGYYAPMYSEHLGGMEVLYEHPCIVSTWVRRGRYNTSTHVK